MKVVITSATEKESDQIKQSINGAYTAQNGKLELSFHVGGVGMLLSCFSISKLIFEKKPDLIIQVGIAGSFDNNIPLGKVVAIKEEILADTGVEESGSFKDVFDLNLQPENLFPFEGRKLRNKNLKKLNGLGLDEVTGITINEITTRIHRIDELKTKYSPIIESMEGASLHYCCLYTSTPFIQIRTVSNYVGERDKSKWNFKDSLNNLTQSVVEYVEHLARKELKF